MSPAIRWASSGQRPSPQDHISEEFRQNPLSPISDATDSNGNSPDVFMIAGVRFEKQESIYFTLLRLFENFISEELYISIMIMSFKS